MAICIEAYSTYNCYGGQSLKKKKKKIAVLVHDQKVKSIEKNNNLEILYRKFCALLFL